MCVRVIYHANTRLEGDLVVVELRGRGGLEAAPVKLSDAIEMIFGSSAKLTLFNRSEAYGA